VQDQASCASAVVRMGLALGSDDAGASGPRSLQVLLNVASRKLPSACSRRNETSIVFHSLDGSHRKTEQSSNLLRGVTQFVEGRFSAPMDAVRLIDETESAVRFCGPEPKQGRATE